MIVRVKGRFFDSSSVVASRADGIHPTRQGAAQWVDKIVEWMGEPGLNANPIEMDKPDFTTRLSTMKAWNGLSWSPIAIRDIILQCRRALVIS